MYMYIYIYIYIDIDIYILKYIIHIYNIHIHSCENVDVAFIDLEEGEILPTTTFFISFLIQYRGPCQISLIEPQ